MGELVKKETGQIALAGATTLATLDPERMAAHFQWCQYMAKTEVGGKIGTAEDIFLITEAGSSVGLSLVQSLKSVCCINGKTALYGEGFLAVLYNSPHFINSAFKRWTEGEEPNPKDFVNKDGFDSNGYLSAFPLDFTAYCTMQRDDQEPLTYSFSVQEARIAGLWGKQGPWKTYPKRMLGWKPVSWLGKDIFPDVLNGLTLREEAIEVEYQESKPSRKERRESSKRDEQEVIDAILEDD